MTNLNSPIKYIAGIGSKYAEKLKYLGIETVRDLIYYLPYRYDDLSNIEKIRNLKVDVVSTVEGKIIDAKNVRTFKKRMSITEILIQDDLAKKADIKYTTLMKVESGTVNKPSVQTMDKIAKALGVSIEDLIK